MKVLGFDRADTCPICREKRSIEAYTSFTISKNGA